MNILKGVKEPLSKYFFLFIICALNYNLSNLSTLVIINIVSRDKLTLISVRLSSLSITDELVSMLFNLFRYSIGVIATDKLFSYFDILLKYTLYHSRISI